ncbi:OmpA family protein [Methylobacterium nodulans]|uniref:OmpA/MotB domain protein n=1 Tax=Methylobacterium nodulans (strain LMG 21967 / CNCM I-2342 / ORS 2060) TaxID=460265 RepID=B8ILZ2_METNO|nr:OmpA family protein [Methylobacterium nodulans]ACL56336.1 OmpA/MotB domain protein [Methylobacterium nodulans ORS 2060]
MTGCVDTFSHRMRRAALLAGLLVLGSGAGAYAQAPSEADIVKALTPAPAAPATGLTRSLSTTVRGEAGSVAGDDRGFLDSLRNRTSLTPSERSKLAAASADKPSIDLEIPFDYNSSKIGPKALPVVKSLGAALARPELKGNTFLIVGHTDGKGKDQINQTLSERRAEAVKQYIVQNYGVPASNLVSVGYGKSQLKDTANPLSAVNRRVTAVNMSGVKSASRY